GSGVPAAGGIRDGDPINNKHCRSPLPQFSVKTLQSEGRSPVLSCPAWPHFLQMQELGHGRDQCISGAIQRPSRETNLEKAIKRLAKKWRLTSKQKYFLQKKLSRIPAHLGYLKRVQLEI